MLSVPSAKIYFPEEGRPEILNAISGVLENGQLTLGEYGKQFEQQFMTLTDRDYAVAVSSGTAALEVSLRAIGVEGKEVIVPTNTFFATPASVIHAGGKVVFADVTENMCLDPNSLLERITKTTAGVIIVHIGGTISPNITAIREICDDYNLFLLEDAAHAHGSSFDCKQAGSFGNVGAFSFYPTKVMTSGEGGMVVTNDEKIYRRAIILRDQGKESFSSNIHVMMGYSWRMCEVNAILGISQLKYLRQFIQHRQKIAHIYDQGLRGCPSIKPLAIGYDSENSKPNYYKYVAALREGVDRVALKKTLKEKYNIGLSGEVYEVPCHKQPILQKVVRSSDACYPMAENLCAKHICLPIFATMTDEQAHHVVNSIKEAIE